ncbi:MAG: DoxX family protein, partial [Burkholderiales bacterium]|nr:DoxX family protein [Burkholderiales bacterium]
ALALAVFTLAATFLFHNFWAMPAEQQAVQKLMFDKNIAVVGGLLLAYAFGPGRYGVETSCPRPPRGVHPGAADRFAPPDAGDKRRLCARSTQSI